MNSGVTTGVSAYDRAVTIRALANPATTPEQLVRPGHIFPLRYTPGGVLTRGGHTEASVDLARWAGLQVSTEFSQPWPAVERARWLILWALVFPALIAMGATMSSRLLPFASCGATPQLRP